jgi:hypothetical protein
MNARTQCCRERRCFQDAALESNSPQRAQRAVSATHLAQAMHQAVRLSGCENAASGKRLCVRDATRNVCAPQAPVETNGVVEFLHEGIRLAGETTAPQLSRAAGLMADTTSNGCPRHCHSRGSSAEPACPCRNTTHDDASRASSLAVSADTNNREATVTNGNKGQNIRVQHNAPSCPEGV